MSNFLVIGLIVVVWLVVLAPLVVRNQKPIRKAGEAFDETRVIHEGGAGVPAKRRPLRATALDVDEEQDDDSQPEEYELTDGPSIFQRRDRQESQEDKVVANSEESVVVETPLEESESDEPDLATTKAAEAESPDLTAVPDEAPEDEWEDVDKHYSYDDAYTSPVDLMHRDALASAEASDLPAVAQTEEDAVEDELTDEDLEYAASRRGRGFYDPEEDRINAETLYARRQRTLIGLAVIDVVALVLGFVFGGWVWVVPAIAVGLTVLYLVALRSQVRAENELRARRIRHLRRSRLGVRRSADYPERLRRPGAVVLEIDDESPDFEYLETTYAEFDDPDLDDRHHVPRRVG